MVDNASEIDPAWFAGKQRVGVTAGGIGPEKCSWMPSSSACVALSTLRQGRRFAGECLLPVAGRIAALKNARQPIVAIGVLGMRGFRYNAPRVAVAQSGATDS